MRWRLSRSERWSSASARSSGVDVLVLGIAYRADVREDAFSSAFRLRDS